MTRVYYKEAVGAFIVFDVTRADSFRAVDKWKADLDTKVKINLSQFRFMESLCHTAILKKFEFLRQFSKKQNMIKKNYQLN